MARTRNRLSAVDVRQKPAGKHHDGGGLYLWKHAEGGQWTLRFTIHGRRKEMGLGSVTDVGLAEARRAAERWRGVVREGKNPIEERRRQEREAARNLHLLKDVAEDFFEGYKAQLKDDGKSGRWYSPLELHVLPKLGKVPMVSLTQTDIRDVLRPLRDSKPETMRKALNRLNLVIGHAAAHGLDVDLQVVEKARKLIGTTQKEEGEHIPAMDWRDVPAFYASLNDGSVTHLALRLLMLTAVRSAPIRFCNVNQITGAVWTIPARYMKARKGKAEDFRVPLSSEALAVIEQAKRHMRADGFLFPTMGGGGRKRKDGSPAKKRASVISDSTLSGFMRDQGLEARPHGMRTSARTFLSEIPADDGRPPFEIAEMVLAHKVGNKTSKAYERTDHLDERRPLMERWARWVTTGKGEERARANGDNVVPFRSEEAA
ncbi:MAG: tyrosine-type recombinase/integrase [Pseudomonadota bacterium]